MVPSQLSRLPLKNVEGAVADYELAANEVSWFPHMIPMNLRLTVSIFDERKTKFRIAYMRVDNIVNVVRCQTSSLEARNHMGIRGIRLTGGEMLLYGLRIAFDVSSQAKIEDNARDTATDGASVLNQEA